MATIHGSLSPMPDELFTSALRWLREHYADEPFFVERDVVWTVQKRLLQLIHEHQLPYTVANDVPLRKGPRRGFSADLVIRDGSGAVALAAEFKYEPSHQRTEIAPNKLPVVGWGKDGKEGVSKDIARLQEFLTAGSTPLAYAVFIDEGGAFRHRTPHPESAWEEWENGVWVLMARRGA